jgi:shikimate 5-dehydrogenase
MRAGAARVYIASRDEKSLKQAADEFNSQGYPGKCVPLVANLATYDGVVGLVAELEKREKCASASLLQSAPSAEARTPQQTLSR